MNKKIRKILLSFILVISIFSCLCFASYKPKADTSLPNKNSYMLNLQDIYLSFRAMGVEINDFVGTTCIASANQLDFFKVNSIWFNRIYVQISIDYQLTIYYFNSKSGQRVDVVVDNNVFDYNALNINVPDINSLNSLYYYLEASQGIGDLYAYELFKLLFSNVESSYPIKNGIYRFNFPDLFDILNDIGQDYRYTTFTNYNEITWYYRYIIYCPNDIVITFDDRTTISCNIILIGSNDWDMLTFYFLKSDFSSYTDLYYFNTDNEQSYTDDYHVYDEIDNIYLPYNTGIYGLRSDYSNPLLTAQYVFDVTFIYGYANEVFNFSDFFTSIIDVPILYLQSIMSFEVFGINLFYTFSAIITSLLCLWIMRKFL